MEGGVPFSRFEQMVLGQLNTIRDEQRSHHHLCETCFRNIEEQVEDI